MAGVRIRRSGISGRGLFAARVFKRGQRICEYSGPLYRGDWPDNRYAFAVADDLTIDGSVMSNVGRWANHSCKPNAFYRISTRHRAWLHAKRRIEPGEEITFDYGPEYLEIYIKRCGCAACKGRKNGKAAR